LAKRFESGGIKGGTRKRLSDLRQKSTKPDGQYFYRTNLHVFDTFAEKISRQVEKTKELLLVRTPTMEKDNNH